MALSNWAVMVPLRPKDGQPLKLFGQICGVRGLQFAPQCAGSSRTTENWDFEEDPLTATLCVLTLSGPVPKIDPKKVGEFSPMVTFTDQSSGPGQVTTTFVRSKPGRLCETLALAAAITHACGAPGGGPAVALHPVLLMPGAVVPWMTLAAARDAASEASCTWR